MIKPCELSILRSSQTRMLKEIFSYAEGFERPSRNAENSILILVRISYPHNPNMQITDVNTTFQCLRIGIEWD